MTESDKSVNIEPKACPVCNVTTNYVYLLQEENGQKGMWYRCSCGVIFQSEYPTGEYDSKYFHNIDAAKESKVKLSHAGYTYANIIEELTYGRMMLDVGYCSTKNMDFFKERGWLPWGIDINKDIGGQGRLYKGDFY